jgi:NhaA family Na+:H+ antiporter
MLLGSRVPTSLKLFLTALAIIDDLGAVIDDRAVLHQPPVDAVSGPGRLTLMALLAMNLAGVRRLPLYLALGVLLWLFVLKSGIHATLAGVALALTIPLRPSTGRPTSDAFAAAHALEHGLHPWVAFLIIPIFGFANAGVAFGA